MRNTTAGSSDDVADSEQRGQQQRQAEEAGNRRTVGTGRVARHLRNGAPGGCGRSSGFGRCWRRAGRRWRRSRPRSCWTFVGGRCSGAGCFGLPLGWRARRDDSLSERTAFLALPLGPRWCSPSRLGAGAERAAQHLGPVGLPTAFQAVQRLLPGVPAELRPVDVLAGYRPEFGAGDNRLRTSFASGGLWEQNHQHHDGGREQQTGGLGPLSDQERAPFTDVHCVGRRASRDAAGTGMGRLGV